MNQVKNFDEFLFHPHMIGDLLAIPKGKSNQEVFDELHKKFLAEKITSDEMKKYMLITPVRDIPKISAGAYTALSTIYTKETTGRTKDIKSKYLEKGLQTEEDGITALSLHLKKFLKKNEDTLSNEFINGTPDVIDGDCVYDVKSKWDIFTFDTTANDFKSMDTKYYWQLMCYMWLTGKKRGCLVNVLIDTPEHLIEKEQKIFKYDFVGSESDLKEAFEEIRQSMTYDDMPPERKISMRYLDYDPSEIEWIKESVPKFRQYLNFLLNKKISYEI